MKKYLFLFVYSFGLLAALNAQHVTIQSVHTLPSVLVDSQQVQAIVSTVFSSGDCRLINSSSYVLHDTIHLYAYFEVGFLTVICYATDTFNLGLLPCSVTTLHVHAMISGGGTAMDESIQAMSIACTSVDISEFDAESGISVFPNPSSGELFISLNGKESTPARISIFNMTGEIIFLSDFIRSENKLVNKTDVSQLPKGIYLLKVEHRNGAIMKKFVKA